MLEISQIDYILIWGHGVKYKYQIIDLIEEKKDFEILRMVFYHPKNICDLVNAIYSYDYAPLEHLKAKTEYLKHTPNKVFFIFINNKKPCNDYRGEGMFRHLESLSIKDLKEEIRDKYNLYNGNKRTEDHVIHASYNENQTDYILRYIGGKGVDSMLSKSKLIKLPNHINKPNKFQLRKIKIKDIYCRLLQGNIYNISVKIVALSESPHFKSLVSKSNDYLVYLNTYQGYFLTDYHSMKKFLSLEKLFDIKNIHNNYIFVRKEDKKYIILDGFHRSVILLKKNYKEIIVAIKC